MTAGEEEEETGWKYIHGDVFRFPPQKSLFSACVGTGTQILVMAMAIFLLALVGVFYPYNRGALLSACVVSSHSTLATTHKHVEHACMQNCCIGKHLAPEKQCC